MVRLTSWEINAVCIIHEVRHNFNRIPNSRLSSLSIAHRILQVWEKIFSLTQGWTFKTNEVMKKTRVYNNKHLKHDAQFNVGWFTGVASLCFRMGRRSNLDFIKILSLPFQHIYPWCNLKTLMNFWTPNTLQRSKQFEASHLDLWMWNNCTTNSTVVPGNLPVKNSHFQTRNYTNGHNFTLVQHTTLF